MDRSRTPTPRQSADNMPGYTQAKASSSPSAPASTCITFRITYFTARAPAFGAGHNYTSFCSWGPCLDSLAQSSGATAQAPSRLCKGPHPSSPTCSLQEIAHGLQAACHQPSTRGEQTPQPLPTLSVPDDWVSDNIVLTSEAASASATSAAPSTSFPRRGPGNAALPAHLSPPSRLHICRSSRAGTAIGLDG